MSNAVTQSTLRILRSAMEIGPKADWGSSTTKGQNLLKHNQNVTCVIGEYWEYADQPDQTGEDADLTAETLGFPPRMPPLCRGTLAGAYSQLKGQLKEEDHPAFMYMHDTELSKTIREEQSVTETAAGNVPFIYIDGAPIESVITAMVLDPNASSAQLILALIIISGRRQVELFDQDKAFEPVDGKAQMVCMEYDTKCKTTFVKVQILWCSAQQFLEALGRLRTLSHGKESGTLGIAAGRP